MCCLPPEEEEGEGEEEVGGACCRKAAMKEERKYGRCEGMVGRNVVTMVVVMEEVRDGNVVWAASAGLALYEALPLAARSMNRWIMR